MNVYRTDCITKIDETLIAQWKTLWNRAENATIYNSYEYFLTWQELIKATEYELFVCYKKDTLVAILPLQKTRNFGVSCLTTLFNDHLVDTAFLIESYNKELLKYFFAVFLNKNIFFQKIDKNASAKLQSLFPQFFFSLISVNPIINLNEDTMKHISSSTIKQIKKTIRKSDGKLHFEVNNNSLQKHLKTMFALEKQSSKKLRNEDIFSHKENRDFYSAIVKYRSDLVRICFLYFDKTPIAYQYGYLYKKSFACDQIAFHSEYSIYRPGKTILYYLIELFKDREVLQMDLGGGISTYKLEFTNDYRLLYNLYYSPNVVVMTWWKTVNSARRVKQILFPKKHTIDNRFLFKTFN